MATSLFDNEDKWTDSDIDDLLAKVKRANSDSDGNPAHGTPVLELHWLRFREQSLDLFPLAKYCGLKFVNCIFENVSISADYGNLSRSLSFDNCFLSLKLFGKVTTLKMWACYHQSTRVRGEFEQLDLRSCAGKKLEVRDAKISALCCKNTVANESRLASEDRVQAKLRFVNVSIESIDGGQMVLQENGAMLAKSLHILSNANTNMTERLEIACRTAKDILNKIGQQKLANSVQETIEMMKRRRLGTSLHTYNDITKDSWNMISQNPHLHVSLANAGSFAGFSIKQFLFPDENSGRITAPDICRQMMEVILERQGLTDKELTEPFLSMQNVIIREFKGAVAIFDGMERKTYVVGRKIGAYAFPEIDEYKFCMKNTKEFSEATGINLGRSYLIETNVKNAVMDLINVGER